MDKNMHTRVNIQRKSGSRSLSDIFKRQATEGERKVHLIFFLHKKKTETQMKRVKAQSSCKTGERWATKCLIFFFCILVVHFTFLHARQEGIMEGS